MAALVPFVITTSQDPSNCLQEYACSIALQYGAPFVKRGRYSLAGIQERYNVDCILVFTQKGPVLQTPQGEYFFHLSMADLRIKNLVIGKHDHMIAAMQLAPGMSVLDCTLGLGTDAIVASFVAGPEGKVTGLESAKLIALIARLGLAEFHHDSLDITQALRRIQVIHADYSEYLSLLPDKSYDIVYFDPMFRQPVYASSNFKPFRALADKRPLSLNAVNEACRVARKRIVIKEKNASPEFARLGFNLTIGGKHSRIHYGVRELGSWNAS